jgi:hypothetical protein
MVQRDQRHLEQGQGDGHEPTTPTPEQASSQCTNLAPEERLLANTQVIGAPHRPAARSSDSVHRTMTTDTAPGQRAREHASGDE